MYTSILRDNVFQFPLQSCAFQQLIARHVTKRKRYGNLYENNLQFIDHKHFDSITVSARA